MTGGPVELVSFPGLPASAGFFLQKDRLKKDEYDSGEKCSNPKCPGGHGGLATYSDDQLLFGNKKCWAITLLPAYAAAGGLTIFNRFGRVIPREKVLRTFKDRGLAPPFAGRVA